MAMKTWNIVIAGLGGQGIITASDIIADAAFRAGFDVKKAEVHGMSQRGGSVNTDVRFGEEVRSPMVPDGEADLLLLVDPTQEPVNQHRLSPSGRLISATALEGLRLPSPKTANVALIGMLSAHLDLPQDVWQAAIKAALPESAHAMNLKAFDMGRSQIARP